jgi:hypothetical protein
VLETTGDICATCLVGLGLAGKDLQLEFGREGCWVCAADWEKARSKHKNWINLWVVHGWWYHKTESQIGNTMSMYWDSYAKYSNGWSQHENKRQKSFHSPLAARERANGGFWSEDENSLAPYWTHPKFHYGDRSLVHFLYPIPIGGPPFPTHCFANIHSSFATIYTPLYFNYTHLLTLITGTFLWGREVLPKFWQRVWFCIQVAQNEVCVQNIISKSLVTKYFKILATCRWSLIVWFLHV